MRLKPSPVNRGLLRRSAHFKVLKRSAWHPQICFDPAILVRLSRSYRYGIALRTSADFRQPLGADAAPIEVLDAWTKFIENCFLSCGLITGVATVAGFWTPNEREMNAPMLKD
jgi:hypothetical protein